MNPWLETADAVLLAAFGFALAFRPEAGLRDHVWTLEEIVGLIA